MDLPLPVARRAVDLVFALVVALGVLAVVLGHAVPLLGARTIVIGGGSMSPAIPLGAAVVEVPVAASAIGVGDVVTFRPRENLLVTHRVTRVVLRADGRYVETRGDANGGPDPVLTPASAVVGRVMLVVPAAGFLLRLLSLPSGVAFVAGLVGALLAARWLLEPGEDGWAVVHEAPSASVPLAPRPAP